MRPLFRWTYGPCKPLGFEILKESVRTATNLYPEFDFIICYNQLNDEQVAMLEKIGIPLYAQKHEELPYGPTRENWKLYPPRLRQDAHELVIDNDLVITKHLPELQLFLHYDKPVITQGLYRNFGKYDHRIQEGFTLNSGLYGMPPGYDFTKAILEFIKEDTIKEWGPRFDDQGIIAGTLGAGEHIYITKNILHIQPTDKNKPHCNYAYHFLGANRAIKHYGWDSYKHSLIKFL